MSGPDTIARIGYLIGAAVFGAASVFVIRTLMLGLSSRSWPVAKGLIVESSVTRIRTQAFIPSMVESVRYTYTVSGATYEGTNLGEAATTLDEDSVPYAAKVRMQRYRPGTTVDVHYDPRRPDRSVLEPGVTPHFLFQVAFVVFATGACVWLAAVGYKS